MEVESKEEKEQLVVGDATFVTADPKNKRTSPVYEFFLVCERKKKVACKKCRHVLVGINTSNMRSHMAQHNSNRYPDVQQFLKGEAKGEEEKKQAGIAHKTVLLFFELLSV